MYTPITDNLKLIIFDCDGVLVDSERLANRVFWEHLKDIGWTLSEAETQSLFIGRSLSSCAEIAEKQLKKPIPPGFINEMQSQTMSVFAKELQPMNAVREVCEFISQKEIDWVVASSGSHHKITTNLASTGLIDLFPNRFSSSDVKNGKPAPDLFQFAAKACGIKHDQCLVIEDSPAGLEAAANAGMNAVYFDSNKLATNQPYIGKISSLSQLIELL